MNVEEEHKDEGRGSAETRFRERYAVLRQLYNDRLRSLSKRVAELGVVLEGDFGAWGGLEGWGVETSGESFTSIPSRTPAGPCAAISCRLTFQGTEEPAYHSVCCVVSRMPHTVLGSISSHPGGCEPFANSTRRTRMASLGVE